MANKWDERKKAQEDEYFIKKEKEAVEKLRAKHEREAKRSIKEACICVAPNAASP